MISTTLQKQFQEDGYVAVPSFLNSWECEQLLEHVLRFIKDVVPTMPAVNAFYEDKSRPETLKQLQGLHSHDRLFAELFLESKLRSLAESLLDDEVIPRDMQYFRKPPLVGQATPPHQDGYYFKLEPPSAVTMWLALDTVDSENGCLHYVKGSHARGMRPHGRTETLGFSQGIVDFPRAEDTAGDMTMCANPGDLIAHHALTIHRADGNKSIERDRRALGFVYFARSAKEDVAGRQAYKDQVTRSWKEAGKL